ncbi:MAG: SDR family NAD(P)-dependent oxidoreductase [Proteobacteria bacterium]|nr:SDR family NAD(P)-dependent oxidoreductase [Pseudomonadota bacterium]NBQ61109.1 SDR family NAD(P)-dependent oxidoreductase [Pseudomonadota bacterium]NBY46797.1 SDR family NAD(P)-dependent oxidoreductase [Pseudomonadota bacterium]
MRERRSGAIVHISSISIRMAGPRHTWDHCTEVALEAVSDRLRVKVKPFGIDVFVIEPGSIQTEYAEVAVGARRAESGFGPYRSLAKAIIK